MSSKKTIRLGIVVDPGYDSGEDEFKGITKRISENLERRVKLVASGFGIHVINVNDADVDLLVIDYGGLSVGGGYDTSVSQIKAACQWAEDHPGRPLVIWTEFTHRLFRDELEEQFGHLSNILIMHGYLSTIPYCEEGRLFWKSLKQWLS